MRLPDDVEVLIAGTDLLRVVDQLVGRSEVFLLDALLDASANEPLVFFDPSEANLRTSQPHAHHLSAPASLELLTSMFAELKDTRFTWCLIPVKSASAWTHLSSEVRLQTAAIVELLLERLGVTPLELG